MSTIIESLEDMAKKESKVRAVLKRSLSFDPGTYPPAFPYVEPRLSSDDNNWKRIVYYLVAGLWARHWRGSNGLGQYLPDACRTLYVKNDKSASIEKRFITLLDADDGQLAYRLRQMLALLKDYPIDFDGLLKDLFSWNHPDKFVQIRWARGFYGT
ncbi:MAG: type I-E CRISPR-associated protein Cse2/CasB [Candidatus Aureabacteria bacterium]|nr:type I-E CRISPR-associated protein Cse2/CasB [Candidatus Auribacterota bacterium]